MKALGKLLYMGIISFTHGQLTITESGTNEAGSVYTLKCNIPSSYTGPAEWFRGADSKSICFPPPTACTPPSDGNYVFSTDSSSISVSFSPLDASEDGVSWICKHAGFADTPLTLTVKSSVDTTTESLTTTDIETTTFQLSTTTQARETTAATNSESTDSTNSETTTSTNFESTVSTNSESTVSINSETTASINSESTALTNSETSVSTNSKTTVATNSGTTAASNSRTTVVSYSVTTATSSSRTTVASNSVTSIVGNNSINTVDNQSAETVLIVSTVIPIAGMIILFIATLATVCTLRKRKENKDDLETSDKKSNVRKEHIYQSESSRKTHGYNQHIYSYTGRMNKRPEPSYDYTNYYSSGRQMNTNQHAAPYNSRRLPVAYNPSYMHKHHGPGIQDYSFYTGNAYYVPYEDY